MTKPKMKNGTPVIIKNLTFGYEKEKSVFEDLSMEIKAGEKFGIIGQTGAGKSTLLLHLNGILTANAGSVIIGDLPVTKENLPQIRRKVGIVFQNPDDQLFNPTVEEDIAFGPLNFGLSREEVDQRVGQALDAFDLRGFEELSSHHLSYGERKRVALATVLAMEPEVVAFDEPFSNLNPGMVSQIIDIIRKMKGTVIIVSQSILPAFAVCDRIAVLHQGEIRFIGTPKEIAAEKTLLVECGLDYRLYYNICKTLGSGSG